MAGETRFRFWNARGDGRLCIGVDIGEDGARRRLLTVAYLSADEGTQELTLAEAWSRDDGCIVVLGDDIHDALGFERDLEALPFVASTRLLWIANPSAPPADWELTAFALAPSESGWRRTIAPGRVRLTPDRRGYALTFGIGSEVGIDDYRDEVVLRAGPGSGAEVAFARNKAALDLDERGARFGLASPAGASARFDFVIPGGEGLAPWLEALDVGLRYSYPEEHEEVGSVRFPVVSPHPALPSLTVRAELVLARLTDVGRSRFVVDLDGEPRFTSWLRTVDDRSCILSARSLAFVLQPLPTVRGLDRPDRLTLAPAGRFGLRVGAQRLEGAAVETVEPDADPGDHHLLCGASGGEYVRLPDSLDDVEIELVPGQPAFSDPTDPWPALRAETTTAWLRVWSPSTTLEYLSQPEGAATLFDATNTGGSAQVPVLPYLPVIAGRLAPDTTPAVPWVSMAGVDASDAGRALLLEVSALSPTRSARLTGPSTREAEAVGSPPAGAPLLPTTAFVTATTVAAITPRGLEGEFTLRDDGGQTWNWMQLARLLPPNAGNLRIEGEPGVGITDPLLSAMLTNQQFLVISDPHSIAPFFAPSGPVEIGGWEVLLDPSTWGAHGTILIAKNADRSVADLAADLGSWTNPDAFNIDAGATQARLLEIFREAEAGGDPDRDFDFFVDVVLRSKDWNGFLFLQADLGRLPDELAGLRAGIDDARFVAHHLGITQTAFTNLEDVRTKETSLFGLIVYDDPPRPSRVDRDYDFRVERLDVLIRDSSVADFRSTVALGIGRLFGQVPLSPERDRPTVRMAGVRQRRGDVDTYMFSSASETRLEFGPGVLRSVTFVQAELTTASTGGATPGGSTTSQFSFVGWMELADVSPIARPVDRSDTSEGFDLFSFGALGFSDLTIQMRFLDASPSLATFEVLLDRVQLQAGHSTSRDGSLFQGFPVQLSRLIGGGDADPGSLGFMTVRLPAAPAALPKEWYGLELLLQLGTLTDMAGAAGAQAALLLAWGPRPGQFLVGLTLPGSGGSSAELSLLGVLNLSIYTLELRRYEGVWALLLNGMKVTAFKQELPPEGSFDFYLFGQPDPSASTAGLGWYGAYRRPLEPVVVTTAIEEPPHPPALAPTVRRRGPRGNHPWEEP